MNSNFRNLAIWVVIGLLLMALFNLFQNPGQSRRGNEISYSEFLGGVESGNVAEVTIAKHRISGVYKDARYKNEAMRQFDVDDFVAKPLSPTDLRAILSKHLG